MSSAKSKSDRGCSSQGITPAAGLAQGSPPLDAVPHRDDEHDDACSPLDQPGDSHLALPQSSSKTPVPDKNVALRPAMPPKEATEAPAALKQASSKYGRAVTLQDRFLTVQSHVKAERDTVITEFDSLKKSLAHFVDLFETGDSLNADSAFVSSLKLAHNQIVADGKVFEDQMGKVIKEEQTLGDLEYKLGELLQELLNLLGSCFPGVQWTSKAPVLQDSPSSQAPQSPNLQPIESEYYDKRGDVRLLRDQLYNHLAEFEQPAEEEVANAFTSTHANPPTQMVDEPSSQSGPSGYRSRWQSEHGRMQSDLVNAESELKRLWHACKDAGINVGDLSIELTGTPGLAAQTPPLEPDEPPVELDTPPFLRLDSGGFVSQLLKDFRWPDRGALVAPTLPNLGDLGEKRDFIERWVGELPDTVFGSRATQFDHVISASKKDSDWLEVRKEGQDGVPSNDDVAKTAEVAAGPDREALPEGEP